MSLNLLYFSFYFHGTFREHSPNRNSRVGSRMGCRHTHTDRVEGFFSIFKRGMKGIYQHCGEQHLQRYLTEFDFRYNHRDITDAERADLALKGAEGKRLIYRRAA